ncbi:MAG: fibronectin-binding domain-containing protein [Deltaproteobacteria bacterium]|nr:fibronectin-binding domain-containing protein [Deltaproteobacteria bacterium]
MNPELLKEVVNELSAEVVGATLSSIYQSDNYHLIFKLFARGQTKRLLLSTHTKRCRIHLTRRSYRNPPIPLRFCAYLRAHITGASISEISHRNGEKIGSISFNKGRSEEAASFTLVFELTGKSGNIILLDNNGIVLDAMRHFPSEAGCPRTVVPGLSFIPLPPGVRVGGTAMPKGAFETWNEAADAHYEALEEMEEFDREKGNLLRLIRRVERHLNRKIKNLKSDMAEAEASLKESHLGELLLANFGAVKRGMTEIAVDDYQSDPPKVVQIPLERELGPQENIDRLFKRARKGKRAIGMLKLSIPEGESRVPCIRDLLAQTERAERADDLEAVKRELRKEGYIHEVKVRVKGGREGPSEPIRRFASSEGLEILCGRNDAGNDLLIKRYARGNDLWLHAADLPGSHTLLRLKDKSSPPPRKSIEEAAAIAAFYSKAKGEKHAAVAFTEAKYVKKPKGAKPGAVTITRYKTITVTPSNGTR